MATVLLIANPYDIPTKYGYYWMRKLADYAVKAGHEVIFQTTPTVTTLAEALNLYNPRLVVINGHGGQKAVAVGNNILIAMKSYDPLLRRKVEYQNPQWFAGRIVILATCNTGQELAYDLHNYGAEAVLAFKKPFIFLSDDDSRSIGKDTLAEPFFSSLYQAPIRLINGESFGSAFQAEREAFNHYLNLAESKGDDLVAKYMNFDLVNLVGIGNSFAKL